MSVGILGTMARKKQRPKEEPDVAGIAVRGSRAWYNWVSDYAKFRRLKITDLVDQSLVESATAHGYPVPAPER